MIQNLKLKLSGLLFIPPLLKVATALRITKIAED